MMDKWIHIVAMAILVVGSIIGALLYMRHTLMASVLGVLVIVAALYVGLRRDTYLPFLGETVIPCSVLQERTPEHADTSVSVSGLEPGAKVLFWAAEPKTANLATINDWRKAYLDFANAGVTRVDEAGHVTLRVRKPQDYTVPLKGRLEAHVHWRVCQDGGMMGPVQITPVDL
jgi:hypothetical protein